MNELLAQGLAVMCIGMGTVFVFLTIMIFAMFGMSAIIKNLNKIFPEAVAQSAGTAKTTASKDDENVALAILAAVLKKR